MKKIKLFAMALVAMVGMKVSAVPTFTVPDSTFTLPNVSPTWEWKGITTEHYVAKGDTLVFAAEELYQSAKQKASGMPWMIQVSGGTSGKSWDAMGCFLGNTAWGVSNVVTVKNDTEKFYVLRVKNCAGVQIVAASGSNKKRTIHLEAYELTAGVAATAPAKSATWESSTFGIAAIDGLDGDMEYAILLWNEGTGSGGSSAGNSNWAEIAFITAPDAVPYPYVKSFTMGEIAAAVDTAAKTITAELPYGTNRDDAINNAVVKMGGTAKTYSISGDVLTAIDSADVAKNIDYDLSGITVSTTQFFTVSYFDGSTLLGSEEVAEGDSPIDFAKYQVKAHCSFVTWMDADSVAVNPGDSAIASDANFYGSWSMEVEQSASLNIEQMVLDNGKSYDIYSEMTSAHIQYANVDALDSLNDAKESRNEPYLGLKIKAEGGYIEMGLKAGDSIKVKFGKVSADLKITINGVDSTLTVADAATPFFYHATEDCWVKIATTTSGTVVLKQIMINDNIQEVTLPETPTALMEIMMNAKAEKFILNGKVYFRHNDQVFNAMGQEMKF